jgi:spore germination protein YaaH
MKYLLFSLAVATALSGVMPANAASPTAPPSPAVHDATHPIVMQQAADSMATSRPNPSGLAPVTSRVAAGQSTSVLQKEVFGFALASSLSDPTVGYPTWNFSLLSTVAFFGLHINDDGTIAADSGLTVWNSTDLANLLGVAHAHGTKVVLTIIEQDFTPGTPHMCAALASRATVVSQTAAQVSAKGVDGVNIDFEGLNGVCPNGQTARSMMTDLTHQLRTALSSGSYLSVDTYASSASDPLGFFDVGGLNAYVDSFFVMAYDLEYSNYARPPTSCTSFCLGPTAPLDGYYYNDTTTSSQYIAVVPASKVILGVPYYGRKSCVAGAAPNPYPTGAVAADTYLDASTEASASAVQAGSYTTHRDASDPAGQERWDSWFNTALGCTREMYWDDTVSLGLKYDLINKDGLRGVGIWNLNYGGGAPELWNALASHFLSCTAAAVAANPASPQQAGAQVQLTATAGGCSNPRYEYWVLPPGGVWVLAQAYSTSATYTWNTAGKPPGNYMFSVWVRDAASAGRSGTPPNTYDAFFTTTYSLTTSSCTSMSAVPAPGSPATVGTSVSVTGAGSGCPNPLYEFWMKPPGGGWSLAHAYSSNPTFTVNTAGKAAGSYLFSVWARDSSSRGSAGTAPNTYDAYATVQYVLALPACTGMSASTAPATSAALGTPVTMTGAATGCPNPLYEFWIKSPGGTWSLARAYSSSATLIWITAGKPSGPYLISVWVRDTNSPGTSGTSPATYDAFSTVSYALT